MLGLTTASAPKRKLEDFAKKLELLYDKLRERAVSFINIYFYIKYR